MQTCQTVFQVPPFEPQHSLEESYIILTKIFESIVSRWKNYCCTSDNALNYRWSTSTVKDIHVSCPVHGLWNVIGWALAAGLGCFFIVPGPNAVVGSAGPIPSMVLRTRLLDFSFTTHVSNRCRLKCIAPVYIKLL
jgi:hypothetical protein